MRIALAVSVLLNAALVCAWAYRERQAAPSGRDRYQICKPGIPDGEFLPEFSVEDVSGKKTSLAGFDGKLKLISFWALWCQPCLDEIPHLQQLYERYQDSGLSVISVNIDDIGERQEALAYLQRAKVSYPVYFMSPKELNERLFVHSFPTGFLVGQDGKLIRTFPGLWRIGP
jgi:thiol-disulfide isomerase/thioredoxin